MRAYGKFVLNTFVAGFLVVTPIYLAALVLLKALKSLIGLVEPIAKLLPEWLPAEQILALLLIVLLCFLTGMGIRTRIGRVIWEHSEKSLFQRIPGYAMFRSLAQQVAGESEETSWKPALAEIEEALVPAFIIEELDDGRLTVFVPSVPTPFAGAIYILSPDRVHPLDVPFTQAVKVVSRWGLGSKELVAAMEQKEGR